MASFRTWMSQISIMQTCCVFLNNMLVQLALTHSSFLYRMTVHRPICEVSKCARFCYWGNLPQRIPQIETSHLSDTTCAGRGGLFSRNTVFGLQRLTKGHEESEQYRVFKIRSLNSRWHPKYHPVSYNLVLSLLFSRSCKAPCALSQDAKQLSLTGELCSLLYSHPVEQGSPCGRGGF